jgi:glycerol kinase
MTLLFVDGGASKNDFLMQLLADFANRTVRRGTIAELSPYGAGKMAAEALQMWDASGSNAAAAQFEPNMSAAARAEILKQWSTALRRTMYEPA